MRLPTCLIHLAKRQAKPYISLCSIFFSFCIYYFNLFNMISELLCFGLNPLPSTYLRSKLNSPPLNLHHGHQIQTNSQSQAHATFCPGRASGDLRLHFPYTAMSHQMQPWFISCQPSWLITVVSKSMLEVSFLTIF